MLASIAVIGAASIWLAAALVQVATVSVSASDLDVSRANRLLRLESALRVLAGQLVDQRDQLAAGLPADLPEETTLWTAHGRRIVVRLLAEGDAVPEPIPEAAALDANHATAEALALLEGMDGAMAEAIIAARGSAPQGRLADLPAVVEAAGLEPDAPVVQYLTVYAHAPLRSPSQVVVQPWSEDLRGALGDVLDDTALDVLAGLPEGDADTFAARVAAASPSPETWGSILRHAAPEADGFLAGRIDLASAPPETLATLEGIDIEKALHLVAVRDTLPDDARAGLSWPWTEGGLDRSLEAHVLQRITVGSWTWRCTLACGEVVESDDEGVIRNAAVYEVIFDVAEETPRIAMLRERLAAPGMLEGLPLPAPDEMEADESPDEPQEAPMRRVSARRAPAPAPDSPAPTSDEGRTPPVDPRVGRWR